MSKLTYLIVLATLASASVAWAFNPDLGFDTGKNRAVEISVDSSSFSGNLNSGDSDVQSALTTIDGLVIPLGSNYYTKAQANATFLGINVTAQNSLLLAGHNSSYYQPAGSYISNETDPIFNASAAKGIVAGNITNWNGKEDALGFTAVPNSRTVNGHALTANVTVSKGDVDLGNVTDIDTTTTVNITDSANKRFVTDAKLAVLNNTTNTNSGDQVVPAEYTAVTDYYLTGYNHTTGNWSSAEVVPTNPGGNDTEIQFNNNGTFGGNANFTFNSTTGDVHAPKLFLAGEGAGEPFELNSYYSELILGDVNGGDNTHLTFWNMPGWNGGLSYRTLPSDLMPAGLWLTTFSGEQITIGGDYNFVDGHYRLVPNPQVLFDTNLGNFTGNVTVAGTINGGTLTVSGAASVGNLTTTGTVPTWNQNTTGTAANLSATAWTAYTPTVRAGSDSFNSVSAAGRYIQIGKTVFFDVLITIVDRGTAGGYITLTYPVAPSSSTFFVGAAREKQATGIMGQVFYFDTVNMFIQKYDGTFLGASGQTVAVSGTYEAA